MKNTAAAIALVACAAGGLVLALAHVDGWGWLIFLAFLIASSVDW